ncbi:hypothetical protein N7497_004235 [Penicillium chrysogenum]|nr:hypothetical protein N7497_004235 [Penicillium chrysogenum]
MSSRCISPKFYLDGLPIAARTLKTLDQRRQTVHRLEAEPSSCHNALPANVNSVIVKQQKDGWVVQFQREKEAYKRLENLQGTIIPRLFGEGSLNGIPALILSEVSGSTLDGLARNNAKVSEDTLLSQLQKVFSLLQKHGVEYGDLRPENFLLCENGKIVILDLEDVSFLKGNWGSTTFGGLRLPGRCWLRDEQVQRYQKPKPSFIACSISTGAD